MSIVELSGRLGLIGALAGLRVIESTTGSLKYDEMYVSHTEAAILVGELNQFTYRLRQLSENQKCREAAAAHIKATATRILGEPWELSSN